MGKSALVISRFNEVNEVIRVTGKLSLERLIKSGYHSAALERKKRIDNGLSRFLDETYITCTLLKISSTN